MNLNNNISELIFKEISNTISKKELQELTAWKKSSQKNQAIYNEVINEDNIKEALNQYFKYDNNKAWSNIKTKITMHQKPVRVLTLRVLKYAAVISIPLILGVYLYSVFKNTEQVTSQISDFKPGTEKAILILSNGNKVTLGNQQKSKNIVVSNVSIAMDTNSTLIYDNKHYMLKAIQ